jgi:two-component system sensor histidine kinase KdpD
MAQAGHATPPDGALPAGRVDRALVAAGAWARRRGAWWGYVAALGAVVLVSLAIGVVLGHVQLANVSLIYVLAVIGTAIGFGRGPAILASLAAFLILDWFFVQPLHTFTVSDPDEWLALLFFLLVASLTGQLAADQRRRAREAVLREREAVVLYDVVRLMGEPDVRTALGTVAQRLREELDLDAVAVDLLPAAGGPLRIAVGDAEASALLNQPQLQPTRVLHLGPAPGPGEHATTGSWARLSRPSGAAKDAKDTKNTKDAESPLAPAGHRLLDAVPVRAGERHVGTLYLLRRPAGAPFGGTDDRLLSAVASQLGLAVERARLRREATDAEVLRRTDQLRTTLLNAVSHDLRTPLASIIASAGSLRQRDVAWTPAEQMDFARVIEEEAQRLNRIVGNLLDLSRIEGGTLRPEKGWYDVGALVDDVLGRLRPLTARHQVSVDVQEDLPPVPLDYVEVDQVLSNVLENAVKYAPPGTEISLRVRAEQDLGMLRIEVADRGPGIPAASLPRLFDPFYRVVEEAGRPRPRGLGLGLAVAKGLVEAHDGRIWAENRPRGGTRVVLLLPLGTPAPAAIAPSRGEAVA